MAEPVVIAFPTRRDEAGVVWEPRVDEDGVARHFSVSGRTVRRWRAEGRPSRVVGGGGGCRGVGAAPAAATRSPLASSGTEKGGAVSVRRHNGRWVVELYDPATRKKRQLNQREIRALGHEPPRTERAAKKVERTALSAIERRRPGARDETVASFAARWPDDYRRGRRGRMRGDSTVEHN